MVEGPLVSRGYLNDEGKTAVSFIANPIWAQVTDQEERRMYVTGDLVRYNGDGSLDYLGRKDSQVKVRGQRLELGDIEHHIYTHSDFERAVALVRSWEDGQQSLVAVLQLSGSNQEDDDEDLMLLDYQALSAARSTVLSLREYLSNQLPGYMVPTEYLIVNSIPLNTSGKIDRAKMTRWIEVLDTAAYKKASSSLDEVSE